jgi:hypothetical protein
VRDADGDEIVMSRADAGKLAPVLARFAETGAV